MVWLSLAIAIPRKPDHQLCHSKQRDFHRAPYQSILLSNVGTNTDWNALSFSMQILSDLDFSNDNFSNANLSNAKLIRANFINVNFSNLNLINTWVNFEGYNYLAKNGYSGYRSRDFQNILADDGTANYLIGCSVFISGGFAIVEARGHDDHGADSGSVYVVKFR